MDTQRCESSGAIDSQGRQPRGRWWTRTASAERASAVRRNRFKFAWEATRQNLSQRTCESYGEIGSRGRQPGKLNSYLAMPRWPDEGVGGGGVRKGGNPAKPHPEDPPDARARDCARTFAGAPNDKGGKTVASAWAAKWKNGARQNGATRSLSLARDRESRAGRPASGGRPGYGPATP